MIPSLKEFINKQDNLIQNLDETMKTLILTLLIILGSCFLVNAQNHPFTPGLRLQISPGIVFTRSNLPELEFDVPRETYTGLQESLQVSFFVPVKFVNIGIGSGLSFRPSDVIYPSTVSPKVFLLLEFFNASKRSPFSFIVSPGFMRGAIQDKAFFYIGWGPSFNFGKNFNNFTFSINPYFETHADGKAQRSYNDNRMGNPNYRVPYTLNFRTTTFNLSCLIQMNFNRNRHEPATNKN